MERMSMQHPMFAPALQSTDAALLALLTKITRRGVTGGDLTLKLHIELEEQDVISDTTGELQHVAVPTARFKVAFSVKDTEELSGDIPNESTGLIRTEEGWRTVQIGSEQLSLYE